MREDKDQVEVREATDDEQKASLDDALARLNKAIEEGAEDLMLAPSLGVNDFEDKYPIAVSKIGVGHIGMGNSRHEVGSWVGVRPVGEEYDGKTFLGVLLGDLPVAPMVRYRCCSPCATTRRSGFPISSGSCGGWSRGGR